jgi:hypothetical protein
MKLPSFNDFLNSVDFDKIEYDFSLNSPQYLKENHNPFSKEEYRLIVDSEILMSKILLNQYHDWLSEKLNDKRIS